MGSSLTSPSQVTEPTQDNGSLTISTEPASALAAEKTNSVTSSDDNNDNEANTPTSSGSPVSSSFHSIEPERESNNRDHLVLLAWLIVLLRTREGNVAFEWRYPTGKIDTLSMNVVIPSLESTVSECAARVGEYLSGLDLEAGSEGFGEGRNELLVSTSSLGEESEESKDEVSVTISPVHE